MNSSNNVNCINSLRKHPFVLALLAAGDVSRGGTSATQRQKFQLMTQINVYIVNPVVMGFQT